MSDRITEEGLATIEPAKLWKYTDFFVARPGEFESGDPVFRIRQIPPGDGREPPPQVMTVRHLVVDVADPAEEATRDRIRTAITARMRER